jgi:hypothetical protein
MPDSEYFKVFFLSQNRHFESEQIYLKINVVDPEVRI